jgi:hypothetical protein
LFSPSLTSCKISSASARNPLCIRRQPPGPDLAPRQQLVGADVFALVFRERIEKHGSGAGPIGNQHAVAAGASLPFARDPLLDDPATEIGIDQATGCALDRIAQAPIRNPRAARVSHQPFGFEDSHAVT